MNGYNVNMTSITVIAITVIIRTVFVITYNENLIANYYKVFVFMTLKINKNKMTPRRGLLKKLIIEV